MKPGGLATIAANLNIAQQAADRLERIEGQLRIQTALSRRAEDQDEALHTQWKPAGNRSLGAGLVVVQFDVQDDTIMWELTRIAIIRSGAGVLTAKPAYVALDNAEAGGIVETIPTSQVVVTTSPKGSNIAAYADAFSNKIMVGSGRRIFVVVTTEGTEDVQVNLQVRNLIQYAEATVTDEADADATFLAPAEGRDANDAMTGPGFPVLRHETPDVYAESPDLQPDAGPEHTELQDEQAPGTQHTELLPDAASKLPAHLRDRLAMMGDQDNAGQGDGS